jgi:hypothetical protein
MLEKREESMVGTAAGRMARVALIVSSVLLVATAYAANTSNGRVLVAGAPVAKSEVTVTIVSQCRDQARLAHNGVVFEVKKGIPAQECAREPSRAFFHASCFDMADAIN